MKLFGRTGGYWLFWVSVAYVAAGIINWYAVPCTRLEYIQAAYVVILSLPLWVKPLARFFNIKTVWET